ncbi:hypothetical protein Tco_0685748, partial [Tanacetum coccineum]
DLLKPEKFRRVAKWANELGEHGIEFKGINTIKGQIFADFLAETPFSASEEKYTETKEAKQTPSEVKKTWKLYTYGASISNGSGAGVTLQSPKGKEYTYALQFEFEATNNEPD